MKGYIEQIEAGHKEIRLPFGIKLKETDDQLDISNKPSKWILDIFSDYKQFGTFKVKRPHQFNEGEYIEIEMKDNKIIKVQKDSRKGGNSWNILNT